jgi:hypothetical protein
MNLPVFNGLRGSFNETKLPKQKIKIKVDWLKIKEETGSTKEYSIKSLQ